LADIRIQREVQHARELDVESSQLDIALEAAASFLDVLRAESLERIVRDNLRLTESNLELARRRVAIGYAGPADVYRWESRLASSRSGVLAAVQRTAQLRVILNQLLNRPQLDRFSPQTPRLEDPRLLSGFVELQPYIETVAGGELFEAFLVRQGLNKSPELRAIDALIASRERTALAARRAYWAPEVGLFAQFDTRIATSGAGSEPTPLPGLEDPDEQTWSVGVSASLPLYAGGLRASVLRQARTEVASLMLDRLALAQEIELGVRLTMSEVRATFPSIRLSREGAAAAKKNLELVTESYERGVVSIIDLLDAQDNALSNQAFVVNAEFDFLIALMALQRASNSFGFLMSSAGRSAWFEQLRQFFDDAGWDDDVLGRP
jgi:outer membrane protein TolC